jgi:hypothetical protein
MCPYDVARRETLAKPAPRSDRMGEMVIWAVGAVLDTDASAGEAALNPDTFSRMRETTGR